MRAKLLCLAAMLPIRVAHADVITPPAKGYIESVEIGGIDYEEQVEAPNGIPCDRPYRAPCKLIAVGSDWSPADLPVTVAVLRDRNGFSVFMTSRLSDRSGRPVCWHERSIKPRDSKTPKRLWEWVHAEFVNWSSACRIVQTLGTWHVTDEFKSREADFKSGFGRMLRIRRSELRPTDDDSGFGMTSFLPANITQRTLNAVASACGGTSERLRLDSTGKIEWIFDGSIPYGPNGERPFDSCVDEQIRYFPGYQKRT